MAKWDVFISHASEDKAEVVEPLVQLLIAKGLKVWYDRHALKLGDLLSLKINEGLSNSKCGVVVLSPNYFIKDWALRELEALFSLELDRKMVILLVLHGLDDREARSQWPLLGNRLSVSTSNPAGMDAIVRQILAVVPPGEVAKLPQEPLPPAPVPGVPRLRRGWLLGVAIVPLLAGLGWVGYQELEGQTKGSNDQEVNQPTGEAPEIQAGDPVLEPKQVSSPEASQALAIEPEHTPKLSAYERALQLPGVEKVPGKEGSGSLKLVLDLGKGNQLTLLWIAPGEFNMGSPGTETGRDTSEPLHRVILTGGFFLGVTEVTQAQWSAVKGSRPWNSEVVFPRTGSDIPATHISYADALEFCSSLNRSKHGALALASGWSYGVPSEAQWEYACRAGSETAYCSGNSELDLASVAVYNKNRLGRFAHPVGTKLANAWGLLDMHGNVFEWTSDDWSDGELFQDGQTNPLLQVDSTAPRVVRGGSWNFGPDGCRSAFRAKALYNSGWHAGWFHGFRLALLPGPEAR